jgi:hypothetical protein
MEKAITSKPLGKALCIGMSAALVSAVAAMPIMLANPGQAKAKTYKSYSNKTLKKQATKTIKAAKAKKGSKKSKLKKICKRIVKAYSFYPMYSYKIKGIQTVDQEAIKKKNGYKYIATPTYKKKKGSCYGYASVMGITAKTALGKKAKVRIAYATLDQGKFFNNSSYKGNAQKHAWAEVKLGSSWFIYDANLSEYAADRFGSATYVMGKKKASSSMKSLYKPLKGKIKYVKVSSL